MRVRSGFHKKGKHSPIKHLLRIFGRRCRRLLTMNVFTLPVDKILGRNPRAKTRANSYLRKDIHKKSLENPYKKQKRRGKALLGVFSTYRLALSGILLAIASLAWVGTLFARETFYIERIRVEGTEEIVPEQLKAMVEEYLDSRSLLIIKHAHVLFLNENELTELISRHYGLDSVSFDTHWPSRSMLIKVKEKHSVLAYSVNESFFTIDKQGTITRETDAEEFEKKRDIPVIYDYARSQKPAVGDQVISQENIDTILTLYSSLQKYPDIGVHSFRLRSVKKEKVAIPQSGQALGSEANDKDSEIEEEINSLSESIAKAESIEEKLSEIKNTLNEIEVKKIEEGELDRYLEQEKIFEPSEQYQFNELEVYMNRGWSLKLGARILIQPETTDDYLNIFATLKNSIDINGEVNEYIDLRFPERVYYR